MVVDLLHESTARLEALAPGHPDDIRRAAAPVIAFSDVMIDEMAELKDFLMVNMYKHPKVGGMSENGKRVVTDLFNLYIEKPVKMPPEWSGQASRPGSTETARVVADFIAGMTDRYALGAHQELIKS